MHYLESKVDTDRDGQLLDLSSRISIRTSRRAINLDSLLSTSPSHEENRTDSQADFKTANIPLQCPCLSMLKNSVYFIIDCDFHLSVLIPYFWL